MKKILSVISVLIIFFLVLLNVVITIKYMKLKKEIDIKYVRIIEEKDLDEFGKLLYEIYWIEQEGKYDRLKEFFYNVKVIYHDGTVINTIDLFIEGVRNRYKLYGNFTYTPKGCLYHMENIKGNVKNARDDENIKKYLSSLQAFKSDLKLFEILEKNPENLYLYEKSSTKLGFVRINGKLKLYYIVDLDIIEKKTKI